ncbi:hypothetical protein [Roseofilum casamattae]|uniref:Uncharacterized protein n=1 Tax=Roseofilum casamattae BLCC-M143 TaxID=3022442 RepID=A0ABT7BTD4_9CYAN|nr:hypothetical protein [Roseofilum casamattae]MDJ1182448.1 hypothetical protein [Roseofilum casamattae BLCC-M143]
MMGQVVPRAGFLHHTFCQPAPYYSFCRSTIVSSCFQGGDRDLQ